MEELTLDHICPYLPYGLRVIKINHFKIPVAGAYNSIYGNLYFISSADSNYVADGCKLMLRKMDLTKAITIDEKEVIPIVELAKIAYPMYLGMFIFEDGICLNPMGTPFEYVEHSKTFVFNGNSIENQYPLFQWLFKHKFDVFGLIELGLAIDINTIKDVQ